MKRNEIKKWVLSTLWAVMLTVLSGVTAFADLIIPGQPTGPRPTPSPTPSPTPDPVPDPTPAQLDPTLLTVLIVGVTVIAAAVIAWVIIRKRRAKAK